jgi:diguanylate cyclase (GGDEF)-like protein
MSESERETRLRQLVIAVAPVSPRANLASDDVVGRSGRDDSNAEIVPLRASDREPVARFHDDPAPTRNAGRSVVADAGTLAIDLMFAARDRAAAALDRQEAALDRLLAADYLRRSYRDQLTQTLQRAAGADLLNREIDRAHRIGEPLAVAFVDVVGLKAINDANGHDAGDSVLRAVGASLHAGLRSYDVAVRWGGDEFVCVLPGSSLADAERRFADIQGALSASCPGATITVGLAALRADESSQQVIHRADEQLYRQRRRDDAFAVVNIRSHAEPDDEVGPRQVPDGARRSLDAPG